MANTIKINVDVDDKPVKSLRAELRETINALQQADLGTAKFEELNQKAAALKDKMAEVNEQVAVFSTGSKYEQVSNSFGEITSGLAAMDFDRVTQGAKLFAQTSKSITFKDAIGSVKQLGGAFAKIGKAMLTNPLFLIVAVIAAIAIGIGMLLKELGFLDKIFKVIGDAIGFVIQQLKDLLDWLGLTDYAGEEKSKKEAEQQEKIAKAHEKKREKVVDAYDHEIRMASIAGKDTVSLEKQKQHAIIVTSRAQLEALDTQIKAMRAAGTLTKEEGDKIKAAIAALRDGIHEAKQEIKAITAQDIADQNKADETSAADRATANKNAADKRKQYAADRLAAAKTIRDAEIALMEDGIEKERVVIAEKYKRSIEDVKSNEKLLQTEKDALVLSLQEQAFNDRKALEQKYLDETQAAIDLADAARIAKAAETEEQLKETKIAAAEAIAVKNKEFIDFEIKQRQNLQSAMIGIAEGTVALLNTVAGKSKAAGIAALAIEKGVAIANVVISAAKEMAANGVAAAANPLNAVTFGAAGAAQLLKSNIFTKIRAGLAIATIASTGISGAKSIASGGGGGSAGGGGGGATGQTPSMGQQQQNQSTPQMNLNNGIEQNAGGSKMRERVIVVDYTDIQNAGNSLDSMKQKVTLA